MRMFSRIKAVLIDLSGTIHIESTEIAGSIAALNRLRTSGLKYLFVTNTTKECQRSLHERLQQIGFAIERQQIFSSLIAARDFVTNEQLSPHLMLENSALEDFQDILDKNSSDKQEAVVVGLAPEHFNYDSLNIAFNKLLNGARLIAIHQGRYFKTSQGLALGPGPFVKALQYGASVEQVIQVGKPEKAFFLSALRTLDSGLRPEDAVMIGDDVRDDVQGAQLAGMAGILVRTGKYMPGDETKIDPGPNLTVNSFADAIDAILSDVTSPSNQ